MIAMLAIVCIYRQDASALPIGGSVQRGISILVWSAAPWHAFDRPTSVILASGVRCEFSKDRSNELLADVILFAGDYDVENPRPRWQRREGTLWVYQSNQLPCLNWYMRGAVIASLNGSVNTIVSYEQKSTIFLPYGTYRPRTASLPSIPSAILMSRPKLAVIVMSNCASEDRNRKLDALNRVIGVDIMGKCGTVAHEACDHRDPQCYAILAREYLFYVAIENTDSPDYVTEKIWKNCFESGLVPLVWSSHPHYAELLPPRSFVNVADYSSVESFALAAHELHRFPHLYQHYHEWRKEFEAVVVDENDSKDLICEYAANHRGEEFPAIDLAKARNCDV